MMVNQRMGGFATLSATRRCEDGQQDTGCLAHPCYGEQIVDSVLQFLKDGYWSEEC